MLNHTETCIVNGVEYVITTKRNEDGITSKWSCSRCGITGGSSRVCIDVQDAIIAARTNLRAHHHWKHRSKKACSSGGR